MAKRILKVKFGSDNKHVFVYEDIKDKENDIIDEFDFKSKDKALPAFYTALQAMGEYACRICEFPREYDKGVTVIGVTFSYTEVEGSEDVMGAVITFKKELKGSNSPLIINTPHKPSAFYDGKGDESPQDPALLLSEGCVDALKVLQEEAIRYIDGERDQMSLFVGKAEGKSEKAEIEAEAGGVGQATTPTEKQDADDYQGEAFKPVMHKPKGKSEKSKKGLTKGTEKIVTDFRKNMQKIADDDDVKITISSPDMPGNVVQFQPGG